METRAHPHRALGVWALLVFAFLWIPLGIMAVYAFNSSNMQSWPIAGLLDEVVLGRLARRGGARRARGCR